MELQCVSVVFVFVVMGFAVMVSSLCLVKNTESPKKYLYQCFMSDDYLADVTRAPIDISQLTFINSKIKVVRDGSFTRLRKSLDSLTIFHCDVEEMEDNAFRGLTKLESLIIMGNKLQVIKSAWFVGLSNLKTVSFRGNEIKHVEDNFFSILPPLESLDISLNEITCLPTSSFGNFHVDGINFRYNPITWSCQPQLMKWLKEKNIRYDEQDIGNLDIPYGLTKMCIQNLPESQLSGKFIKNCVENTVNKFLPATGNYTVKQVCELLKNKPSPFFDCTK